MDFRNYVDPVYALALGLIAVGFVVGFIAGVVMF